jgi:hypothetical protein
MQESKMLDFHHNPDNLIRLNVEGQEYFDSLENFLLDWPGYSGLPDGYIEAQKQGIRYSVYTESDQLAMPQAFKDEIDTILENIETIITNKEVREAA